MLPKKVLVVDDGQMIRWVLCQALRDWRFMPLEAADVKTAVHIFKTERPGLTLLDINLPDGSGLETLKALKTLQPDAKIVMITADALIANAITALRAGATDFVVKPINLSELEIIVRSCFAFEQSSFADSAKRNTSDDFGFDRIIGESAKMKEILSLIRKVAKSSASSLLLQGESGTGKDLIAKAVHHSSARAAKPFVAINCAAIPATLIESELFGYEKGAFTDAKARKEGLFEQAQGGTIFLDEIGELDISLQSKLLRVLESGVFRRVGGLKDLPLDALVIAASNRNLRSASEAGKFREDLYFRLSLIEVELPPLRERGDDVLLLATHFVETLDRKLARSSKPSLAPEVVEAFRRYHWAGNVRELRNVVERSLILEEGDQITLKYMPPGLHQQRRTASSPESFFQSSDKATIELPPAGVSLESVEDSLIEQALRRTNGNVTRAAEILNLSRDQMRYRLKKKRLEQSD